MLPELVFHGGSLRGTAECLKTGFDRIAPKKSTVGERIHELSQAAKALFETHFQGRGKSAACDEIYLSGHAALEVVETFSLAITGIQPNTAPSEENWKALLKNFEQLESGASDQGLGVSKALGDKVQRFAFDLWHLLRHFAAAVGRLETSAYERIADVDPKLAAFVAALPCPPGTQPPPELKRLEEAQRKCAHAIHVYDDACTVLGWLYEAARPSTVQASS